MSKKNKKVHYSSKTDNWATPDSVFQQLSVLYGPFELDVSASEENTKCNWFFDENTNGLDQNWFATTSANLKSGLIAKSMHNHFQTVYMNPPYSELKKWLEKAYNESRRGIRVVCLIPSRTDTRAWHSYVMKAEEILFVKGRIKFGDSENSAPFPSAVIIFDPNHNPIQKVSTIEFK